MSQTTVNLGYVLKNRGEYIAEPETRYYHDNVVQYQGSSFIADPVDYNPDTNPLAYVTTPPYDADPNQPNDGWKVFASDAAYVNSFIFFTENSEWAYVVCDSEDKVLFGVKQDGEFYFGAGCPPQVKEYVESKIAEIVDVDIKDINDEIEAIKNGGEEGKVDNLNKIIAFLQDYSTSDSLKSLLNTKVNKEEGKGIIPLQYAQEIEDNPEYVKVTTDSEDKILEGIKVDGTKVVGGDLNVGGSASINGDTKILGNMEVSGVSYKVIENPEYLAAWVDASDKVIFGLKADGKTYVGDADFLNDIKNNQEAINKIKSILANIPSNIDWDALSSIATVENPEFIEAKTDSEGKLLAGRTPDGVAFENVGFTTPKVTTESVDIDGHIIDNIQDPEGRTEIKTDSEGKILSYRDGEGVLHEEVGIESAVVNTNSLNLTFEGMTEFQQALKNSGFAPGGKCDWSDYISNDGKYPLHLDRPRCAVMNLLTDFNLINISKVGRDGAVEGVNYNIPIEVEFWDMQGNYFKKPALISGQGNATMSYAKKNIAIDLFDTSVYNDKGKLGKGDAFKVKFGDWVPQDSFHLKANATDTFRYVNHLSYAFYDKIVKDRGIKDDYVWKRALIDFDSIGLVEMDKDVADMSIDTGAKCFPDGFPVIVYQKGVFWGIYFFSLKKNRDNYHLDKKKAKNIHLDGLIEDTLFMANGNLDWRLICSKKPNYEGRMDGIEFRNPKDLYCVDVSYSYQVLTDADEIYVVMKNSGNYMNVLTDITSMSDSEIRETYGDNPKNYAHNTEDDVWYVLVETPTGTCSKYDADINNHELIDETMPCYDSGNKDHVKTAQVKHYVEDLSRALTTINAAEAVYNASSKTAEDLATLKAVFETYFDVKNLVDYMIHGDVVFNWDGFRGKNWQWFTYDGVKWYCGLYDNDVTFGYRGDGLVHEPFEGASTMHACQSIYCAPQHTLLMNRYIITYYTSELEERYKELRDKGIISPDTVCNLIQETIASIGKDVYEQEWGKWNNAYPQKNYPSDSIYRFYNWLIANIAATDILYNYNQNV